MSNNVSSISTGLLGASMGLLGASIGLLGTPTFCWWERNLA